ncbi:uncharacterized protein LOC143920233 [Arctopsyche grandis]|uniref:uncharacterized protein LOC143920233 n=1 Tax=Arctopsyche grandis TaxID=121162 RepID=UPI00406D9B85
MYQKSQNKLTTSNITLILAALIVAVSLLQHSNCNPILENSPSNSKSDKYAQEAADVLDSTLWFFKDSLSNLIEDSSRLNKMFMNVTDKLKRLTPLEDENQNNDQQNDRHIQLQHLTQKANKTLLERLSKE